MFFLPLLHVHVMSFFFVEERNLNDILSTVQSFNGLPRMTVLSISIFFSFILFYIKSYI